MAILKFLGCLIAPFLLGSRSFHNYEHADLQLDQCFMNALWLGYINHIFLDVNKKALSLCTFVANLKSFLLSELGSRTC